MAFAAASPNEYLVVGQNGKVVNRGSGIQVFLWPGSTYVLVPSTKQEALFEMTQETRDGIPLRFKGIVIYRIVDPVTASMSFNFTRSTGLTEINTLINNICLGELRAAVSGMTMQECIEQRKTVLTSVVDKALRETVSTGSKDSPSKWGIELELVQVAQVFIVDPVLRKQLEAEVRNEIRTKSEQSDIRTTESIRLTQLASDRQVQIQKQTIDKEAIQQKEEIELAQIASSRQIREKKLLVDKDGVRQKEELDQANLEAHRRLQKQNQEAENEELQLAAETFRLQQRIEKEKSETETPVKLLATDNQLAVLTRELEMRKVENQVHELQVARDMLQEKARHELRKEILPMEQAPEIAESLSSVFQDANLTFVGSENQLLSSLLPLMKTMADMVKGSLAAKPPQSPEE